MPNPTAAPSAWGASQDAEFTAALAETRKLVLERFGDGAGYEFVPLGVESFGRLGKDATRFLNKLVDVAAPGSCTSKAAFVRIVRHKLSCALCRGNAGMYDCSLISVARGGGRGGSSPGW